MGRWGFTLIEILIATTLMAALLVALWRLVGIYTALRGKGELHAGRVGNVSVMMHQLEEDLRNLPDVRSQTVPLVGLAAPGETETGPVASEANAFDEAYDDDPAVETLSESALELENADRSAPVMAPDEDLVLSENHPRAPYEGPDTAPFNADQQAPPGLTRSEENCTNDQAPASGQATASCLFGDEQSLTLANLDCQVSRPVGETAETQSQDLLAEHGRLQDLPEGELSAASGYEPSAAPNEPGHGVTVQMPVRFVRYWLAGVMPFVAQTAADEYNRDDSEGIGATHGIGATQRVGEVGEIGGAQELGATGIAASGPMGTVGESESQEGATGLYREEVLGLSAPRRMRPLRGRDPLENLDSESLSDYANTTGMPGLDTPGFNSPYETEDPEEVTRRSFHLAQVEWAKFRYFDGNRWKSSWDSRVQGELPVAIEMSLWLLRQGAKRSTGAVAHETPDTGAAGMTWTEVETMNAADSQLSHGQEDRHAGAADAEQSSLADDNPMERQPEVRQLVVLRTAPMSADGQLRDGQSGDGQLGDRQLGDRQLGDGARPKANSNRAPTSSARAPQRDIGSGRRFP